MNYLEELKGNKEIFLNFMKEKYPVHQNSNIFFRDVLYAIRSYFEKKDIKISYSKSEELANLYSEYLESQNDLIRTGKNSWKVLFTVEIPSKKSKEIISQ